MATVAITPTAVSKDTPFVTSQGAGTAIVAGNTNTFAYPKEGVLLIQVDSDHASTSGTVAAGSFIAAGKGSYTWAVGDTVQQTAIFSSDRFLGSTGNISITWAANSAGYIRAFYLPNRNEV